MNRLHALARVHETVLDKSPVTEKDVYQALRFEIDAAVMSRTEIEGFAKQFMVAAEQATFKVQRARARLDIAECKLRADILDALDNLDINDPNDCRDVESMHREIGSSTGKPSVAQALELLAAGGVDVAAMTAAMEALWPARDEDEA